MSRLKILFACWVVSSLPTYVGGAASLLGVSGSGSGTGAPAAIDPKASLEIAISLW